MASFKKTANSTITLKSNGTLKDGLKVAKWARNFISSCDAVPESKELGYKLSCSHLEEVCSVEKITLSLHNYYYSDLSKWAKLCK